MSRLVPPPPSATDKLAIEFSKLIKLPKVFVCEIKMVVIEPSQEVDTAMEEGGKYSRHHQGLKLLPPSIC